MLISDIEETLETIVDTLISALKIIAWLLLLPLVMIYLYFRYKTEKKLRDQGKL